MLDKNTRQIVSDVIKYKAARPYFGELTGEKLTGAKHVLADTEYGIGAVINIGEINGDVICNALWRQMAYNPARFGTQSPFMTNGVNDIYRFAADRVGPLDDASGAVRALQSKLRYFLSVNAAENRKWRDNIETKNGRVTFVDLSSPVCLALTALQDCVRRIIAPQNGSDFRATKSFRESIAAAVMATHPERFGGRGGM